MSEENLPGPSTTLDPNNQAIQQALNIMNNMNISVRRVEVQGTSISVTGTNSAADIVTIKQEINGGYRAQTTTQFTASTIEERRAIAHDLRSQNLTQQQIADRLGVSQKTVSDDLRSQPSGAR